MAEIVLLAIVQGVTEFLPISSSAHLILISKYFNFSNSSLTLDVSLHFGSLLAVSFYFRKDLTNFIQNKKLLEKIIITSIPVSIFGFFLIKYNFFEQFRSYKIIGWTTIIFGIVLLISDLREKNKSLKKNFNYKNVIIISIFQILSLIPGVSRSGIIISSARILNFNRVDSAKIAFLTSIPILILVSIYNLKEIIFEKNPEVSLFNFFAVAMSFVFSYLTIRLFINFLKKFNLLIFVIYRLLLGIVILFYVYG